MSIVSHCFLPLKNAYVAYLYKVSFLLTLLEQRRSLCDVRIEPHTDFQATFFQTLQVCCGIRKVVLIELQVTPLVRLHPESIEMKDTQGNIAIPESVQKPGDCLFIVTRSKT